MSALFILMTGKMLDYFKDLPSGYPDVYKSEFVL